eukprot:6666571-Ditylum_brightwellii.AAC.1
MRMRISPQMRKRTMMPLLALLPSLTTTGSDNPARSWTHWLIKVPYIYVGKAIKKPPDPRQLAIK